MQWPYELDFADVGVGREGDEEVDGGEAVVGYPIFENFQWRSSCKIWLSRIFLFAL